MEIWIVGAHLLLNLRNLVVQTHLAAFPVAEPTKPLRVEEDHVLAIVVLQPDDEVRIVVVVVEE